ncbi:LysR family transcriptional regulator [Pantoea sp. B550]|uniref:LysR family transcriptional regulator n=1 Tax=Pantoea sp. B550 TaxID=2959338 RepID=UPI00209FE2B7|nr:LysR family transcriptional regulator [Pantoea sp. B550]MCP1204050.1 LysR family transcriptional regulator [Pantoea sp. B550]
MPRLNLNDLALFVAVARARSFTKAGAQLGVSQSALSHAMRGLEERLGVRLLARSTRSVSPTEAGERLLRSLAPRLEEIEMEVASIVISRDQPSGTIRLSAPEHAARTIVYAAVARVVSEYPDICVEISVDHALIDIVADRFDAGIRLGDQVASDMIAVPIAPGLRMAVVGTRSYFAAHPEPQTPSDLARHNCITLRLPTYGNLLPWEFQKGGKEVSISAEGQLIFNTNSLGLQAVMGGLGLGYCPEDEVEEEIVTGRLIRVLEDWCPIWPGYHLYYPSRRQQTPAFALLIDALRYRK